MNRALHLGLILLPLLLLDSQAQDTDSFPRISSSVAEQNLVKKVEPPYPQMARMAHIEGKVVLSIVISPEGKVSSVRAISGHPILIQPTMDAVYKWEYKPFIVDSKARWVTTVVNVPFSLGKWLKQAPYASDVYFHQEKTCRGLLDLQAYAEAESTCALLPGLAEKVNTPDSKIDLESAYNFSGYAYFKASKFQDALTAWQHQLTIAKEIHPAYALELGAAYHNVAHALQAIVDLQQAQSYYEQALRIFEHDHKESPEDKRYSDELESVLRNYAPLLRQLGNHAKAEALEKERESLSAEPDSHK